jgi:hypothetical protein
MAVADVGGSNLYLTFTTVVLDTNFRSFGIDETAGTVLAAAGADADDTYLVLRKGGGGPISFVMQAADTTTWGAVVPGTEGALVWGEEGTASGKPKHTVNAIVTSRARSIPYDDLVISTVTFLYSGAISDSTY